MKNGDVVQIDYPYQDVPLTPGKLMQVLNETMVLVDFGEPYHRALPKQLVKLVMPTEASKGGK